MAEPIDILTQAYTGVPTNVSGEMFELFAQHCFVNYRLFDCRTYTRYGDIDRATKARLGLTHHDTGIDAIMTNSIGEMFAVQVKFRSDTTRAIPYKPDLSTFAGWVGNLRTNDRIFKTGIVFCNCRVAAIIRGWEYIIIDHNYLLGAPDMVMTFNMNAHVFRPMALAPKEPTMIQMDILDKCSEYFQNYDNGRLIVACGVGKTLISYWTMLEVCDLPQTTPEKLRDAPKRVIIFVPSLELLSQVYRCYYTENIANGVVGRYVLVGSAADDIIGDMQLTTQQAEISQTIRETVATNLFIFSTYQSSRVLMNAVVETQAVIDFTIYDEAHRVCGAISDYNCTLRNRQFTDLAAKKLFQTATERIYSTDKPVISMDNLDIFGDYIHQYNIRNAIDDGLLCDYKIVTIATNNVVEDINKYKCAVELTENYPAEYVVIALALVDMIKNNNSTHILLFSNSVTRAAGVNKCVTEIVSKAYPELYTTLITSDDPKYVREARKSNFKDAKLGIISNVKIFNEGVDIPKCDTVVFVDPRVSYIDIIQCVGRCVRLDRGNPHKIGKVLIPFAVEPVDNIFDVANAGDNKFLNIIKILKALNRADPQAPNRLTINHKALTAGNANYDRDAEYVPVQIDEDKLRAALTLTMYSSSGNSSDKLRYILVNHNAYLLSRNLPPLVTEHEIKQYFNALGADYRDITPLSWPHFALGKNIDMLLDKYYKSEGEITQSLRRLNIRTNDDYQKKYILDPKLPSLDLIGSGMYYPSIPGFTLPKLFEPRIRNLDL
nr:Putative ATP-dependent RNA helicase [Faustovirus]